jgi:hypothetical protein
MRDHAPVTETPNTGTPEALSKVLSPAASGNFAGGLVRPPAPLFPLPTQRLILDLVGDCVCVACLFFMLFVGLLFGGTQ